MTTIQILPLALILVTGGLTTYTDLRYRRIKNAHLLLVLAGALLGYAAMLGVGRMPLAPRLVLNPLIGTIIAFTLYAWGQWKAGDAKLYLLYACLLAPFASRPPVPVTSLTLFLNTFLAGCIWLLPLSIAHLIQKNRSSGSPKQAFKTLGLGMANALLVVCAVAWLLQPVFGVLPLGTNEFVYASALYIAYGIFSTLLVRIPYKGAALASCFLTGTLLRICYFPHSLRLQTLAPQLGRLAVYTIIFFLLRKIRALEKQQGSTVHFARFLFAGSLMTYFDFLPWLFFH